MTGPDEHEANQRPFGHELADKETDVPELGATDFEKARGVNRIETKPGYSGVLVSGIKESVMSGRLKILESIRSKGLSLDFLKFTGDGMSFLLASQHQESAREVLAESGCEYEILPDRSILTIYAVNMRDEEGLVARIVSEVISSGAKIDHLGDMHDRLLIVVSEEDAKVATDWILSRFTGVSA